MTVDRTNSLALPWWRQLRWQVAVMLCIATTINQIDRQAFAYAGPKIREIFNLSNIDFASINSCFLFTYGIGQLLTGLVIDRIGTKRAMWLASSWWSVSAILHALGRGFYSFLSLRGLLGITESANYPSSFKAIAEWFPKNERSTATGIVMTGSGLGSMLAPLLLGPMIFYWGWQSAFIVPGTVGLVWALAWRNFYFLPNQHPRISDAERDHILRGSQEEAQPVATEENLPWYGFLQYREVWGMMIARFVGDGGFYFFTIWLPSYLKQKYGFNELNTAAYAWIPFLGADLGSLVGGWFGKGLIERGVSVDRSRKLAIWIGALIVLPSMLVINAGSPLAAILFITIAMFGIQFKSSSLFALPTDLFQARHVATMWGLTGAVGSLGGALFQNFVGVMADKVSYVPVFIAVPVLQLVAALSVTLLIPRIALLKN